MRDERLSFRTDVYREHRSLPEHADADGAAAERGLYRELGLRVERLLRLHGDDRETLRGSVRRERGLSGELHLLRLQRREDVSFESAVHQRQFFDSKWRQLHRRWPVPLELLSELELRRHLLGR